MFTFISGNASDIYSSIEIKTMDSLFINSKNPSIKLVTVPLSQSKRIARCSILGQSRKQQIGKLSKKYALL